MKTYILVANIDNNYRRDIENLENSNFDNLQILSDFLKTEKIDSYIIPLTDFVDACNDQEFSIDNNWITYVNVLN